MAWPGTLPTWTALEKWTAAKAQKFSDALNVFDSAWASYTPVWTATTTNPTLGNGTLSGRVLSAGKFTIVSISTVFGSTTTVGSGTYAWSVSVNLRDFHLISGSAMLLDASAASLFPKVAWAVNSSSIVASDLTPTRVAHNSPIIWATGDRIDIQLVYEAA